ncbi:MAG: VWA domain-containing protein [Candidatus Riflebacteria bacterium]|nr:VWA domain-containing protein [Candidatus Riflebacteria bacterium]
MVEVAPGNERLRIPAWKYILFLVLFLLMCLGILWYMLASNYGASNSLLETLRRYLSFVSAFHPNIKPEDDFSNALRIHGVEKNSPKKFFMFVSMTDNDGSPLKVINAANVTVLAKDKSGADLNAIVDRVRPLHAYGDMADPMSFSSVMDYSGSMFPEDLTAIEDNFSALIDQILIPFTGGVIKFNNKVNEVQPLTTDKNALKTSIKKRIMLQNTALFDGVDAGVDKIQARPHFRFVILTTDGNDNASNASLDDVIRRCQIHNTSVFVFGFGWLEVTNLRNLSNSTDGYYSYVPDSSKLAEWFKKLGQIINNVQVVEFSVTNDTNQPGSIELTINEGGQKLTRTRTWK